MQRLTGIITFIIVFIFCSYINLHLYVNGAGMVIFKPLYWYAITIAVAIALILFKQATIPNNTHRNFLIWLWVYLCFSIINFLYSSQSADALQTLIQRVQMTLLLFSFLILFLQEKGIAIAQKTLVIVVLISVPFNIIDYLNPTWTTVPGRAAGMFANPTISGKILALSMIASIAVIPKKLRLFYCIYAGIGILLTFSRASWMLWALGLAGLAATGYISFKYKKTGLIFITLAGALILYALLSGTLFELLKNTSFANYLTPDTLERLGVSGSAFKDSSANERALVATKAWHLFQSHPWFGMGLAYTQEWDAPVAPHNMYLTMAAEGGLISAGIYIAFLIMLWFMTNPLGKVLVITITLSSIFTHNNLDQPATLIIFSLIAALNTKKDREV